MPYPFKYDRLSQNNITSQHGHLLQESGFTKQGSRLTELESLVRTTMKPRIVSSFLYGTVTGRLSSGRPAMQNIPRTVDPSTSVHQFREIMSMYSTEEVRLALSSALQKIYSRPSRSVAPVRVPLGTQLWGHNLGSTRSDFWLDRERVKSHFGSIQMLRETQRVLVLGDNFDLSALSQYP